MGTVVGMEVRPTSLGKTHKACISEESEKTPNQEERSKNYTKENTRNSNERCLRNEGANIIRCPWQQRQTIARLQRQLLINSRAEERQGKARHVSTEDTYIYQNAQSWQHTTPDSTQTSINVSTPTVVRASVFGVQRSCNHAPGQWYGGELSL